MAYFHCRRRIRTQIMTRILVLCRIFSLVWIRTLLIEMYITGTEVCPWDGDLSLKWVQ